jgi:hypothetical protein
LCNLIQRVQCIWGKPQNGGFQNHRCHLRPTQTTAQWWYASKPALRMILVLHETMLTCCAGCILWRRSSGPGQLLAMFGPQLFEFEGGRRR